MKIFEGSKDIPCQSCGATLTIKANDLNNKNTLTLKCSKCGTNNIIDCKKLRDDITKQLKKAFGSNIQVKQSPIPLL